ncbi:MAG: class I SAM-dependent methyltransferase [Clostridia bacterium]|nr:class I SAM-dependent methyltransferase [Clostridia bacterium]
MHKCIVCGKELDERTHLMRISGMPRGAQYILTKEEVDDDRPVDLQLCQCSGCGLVQFDCEPVDYYRDVIRAGGFSSTMTQLRRDQYKHFIESCGLEGKKIIEIGCGQGEFLQVLGEFPVQGFGIEHSEALVEKARAKGLNVWKAFTETAETELSGAPYDAFLSFNFLEHQPDPNAMLRCIYNNLTDDGYGLITVPSLEYILENASFYELLRDHIANYSEETLRYLVNKNGFIVLECTRLNRDTHAMIVQKRRKVDVAGLRNNFDLLSAQMQAFLDQRIGLGKKVAVWGASHQGFTAISTTDVADKVSYIIDSAPFKQGRFAPASHLPVVSPDYFFDHAVDCILIIAPGYTDEIAKTIRTRYGDAVEIAVLRSASIELYSE